MRATAVEGPGTDGAYAAWWPYAVGAALALAVATACAAWLAPSPRALGAVAIPAHSVAWLPPYDDGTPRHWLEAGAVDDLPHLPRDGRAAQVAILLQDRPDAPGDTLLFLPVAAGAPSVWVNNAYVPVRPRMGEPYPAAPRMRPVAISIPPYFFRPGLNRLDAVFRGGTDPALMAPPLLGGEAEIAPMLARAAGWAGPLRILATGACFVAACLSLAASAFAARGWFLGLSATAAAFGCRLLPAGAGISRWMDAHASLVDHLLLAAAIASLACAWRYRPRIRPGAGWSAAAGALTAFVVVVVSGAAYGSFEPFSGAWLSSWLEAFHGLCLAAAAFALAVASAWIAGRGLQRFASVNLNLSRAVRRQRIEIAQANRALELQRRRAAILEERQRLARDVHDGVGGTLASLLARIRMRHVDIGQIESELVGGLADLRLIVDSMDSAGGSLATALAVFRARIAPQVEAAGMVLAWEQPEHPGGDADDPSWMLHLYRLMQEAVNNALRHSGGRNLLVSVRPLDARSLRIEIADDGTGLPAQRASHGNGLSNMAWRAQRLGAALRFEPMVAGAAAARGTRVVVELALPAAIQPRDGIRPS